MTSIRDPLFADAVSRIDAGDVAGLNALLVLHPDLLTRRLQNRETGYFADPYLLWFVAGNPIRSPRLPANIVDVALIITGHAQRLRVPTLQAQLDYTVGLVATGMAPRESGVQLALIDALVAAGARPVGGDAALAHGELAAVEHLVKLGAPLTLSTACGLRRWNEATALAATASAADKADALVTAAYLGRADAIAFLLGQGADPNFQSTRIHSHSTALHQAALSGRMDTVKLLAEAGASLTARDPNWNGTPAGWAEHGGHNDVAAWLRARAG